MNSAVRVFAGVLLVSCGCGTYLNSQTSEMRSDRARRDTAIRWPAAYDPSVAPVFSHNELLIHADCQRTFAHLADATSWPNWLVIVKDVVNETPGETGQGALYRLKIFNSPIQSRIVEFEADHRLAGFRSVQMRQRRATAITTLGTSSRKPQIASSSPKKQA